MVTPSIVYNPRLRRAACDFLSPMRFCAEIFARGLLSYGRLVGDGLWPLSQIEVIRVIKFKSVNAFDNSLLRSYRKA